MFVNMNDYIYHCMLDTQLGKKGKGMPTGLFCPFVRQTDCFENEN